MPDDGDVKDVHEESPASELEKLRAENIALKKELVTKKKPRGSFWRSFLVWLLIVLACLTAFSGAIAVWVRTTTLDTNNFVNTVAPLFQEDAVAAVISKEAVDALFKEAKITKYLEDELPEDLKFIADPLSSGLESLAELAAKEIIASDQFQWVLKKMLRLVHSEAVGIIRGDTAVKLTEEGKVILDIGELLTNVRDQLVADGLGFLKDISIPESAGQIVLFQADDLGMVKGMVNLLDTLNWLLPLISLILFGAAILIAKDRRKALLGAGVGLAIAMALSLIVLRLARADLLGQIEDKGIHEAAAIIWNRVLSGLVGTNWGVLALGVLVAIGAAIAGPYDWAVSLRKKTAEMFKSWRERRKSGDKADGPFGTFISAHAGGLRIAGAAVAIIVLLLLPTLSALAVVITAVIYVIYLGAIELLR